MKKKAVAYVLALTFLMTMVGAFPTIAFAADNVRLYTTIPGAVASTSYTVTVDGQTVFVEKYKDISYARFAFSGTANITVTATDNITKKDVSPHSYNIAPTVSGKSMNFSLSQSRKLIVTINNLEKLFIFADPVEVNAPKLGDANVYDINDYPGIDKTGAKLNTKEIQNALNDVASKPGGGVLYFPNGKYLTGALHIKSDTTVYLQDGALIQGTSNVEDYQRPTILQDGTQVLIAALVCFDEANNSKLTGRGILDGDGKNLRLNGRDAWLTSVMESSNIVVEDVILRDPAAFNSHICYSDNVTYQRVKLINDISVPNTDGIDPDSSRHVVIDDVFSYCSDDSVSVKTHRYTTLVRDSYDIVVKNNVFWTIKSALKIGDETFAYNMYDITFTNNDVVHADRAVVIYVCDGSTVSNVNYINNRTEEIGGNTFERLIDFWIHTRTESMSTPGKINNVIIKDLFAEKFSPKNSFMEGLNADHKITNVYIDNLVVAGQKKNSLAEARIDINSSNFVQNVVFGPAPELPAVSSPAPFVQGTFIEKAGIASFEAEHFSSNTAKDGYEWNLDAKKAGGLSEGAMIISPSDNKTFSADSASTSPQLNYNINFTKTGTYYVWARMYAQNPKTDYINVGLDGATPTDATAIIADVNPGGWYWSDKNKTGGYVAINITKPGIHTINVYAGSGAVHLDKMFVMQAGSGEALPNYFSPGHKGMGPVESETYPGLPVTIDGELQKYEVPATMLNDRVVVPMRAIFEKLGATVEWNDPTITATKGSTKIVLAVGDNNAYKNGEEIKLDQPPVLINDRTMVPVRFVSEALGIKVEWIDATQTVQIGDPTLAPATGNTSSTPTTTPTTPTTTTPTPTTPDTATGERFEGEKMTLKGYEIDANSFASKSMCIKTMGIGTASFKYTGTPGTYAIKVAYFDENDGSASYKLSVAGKVVDKWAADQDLGNASPITQTLFPRIINGITLKAGDEIKIEGTMDGGEPARVDYIEILNGYVAPSQTTVTPPTTPSTATPDTTLGTGQRSEGEKMTLKGYEIDSNSFSSKSMCIKTMGIGTASFKFTGTPGTYTIKVAYFDENDGAASYKLTVAGKVVDKWAADQDLGNASPITQTLVIRAISAITLKAGDEIKIEGTMDAGEPARIDYIEIQ